jgi:hypothetical protein
MRSATAVLTVLLGMGVGAATAGPASGQFKAKPGVIAPKHAVAYVVRDMQNPRTTRVELMLTDAPIVDDGSLRDALDPHMVAINLDAVSKRNYILLWVSSDGWAAMNATFSATMTQYINDTDDGLKAEFTTNTPTKIEGRVHASALKTMDGETYSVDVRFSADVPPPPSGTPLSAGGGEAGKALTAFLAAAAKKNWPGIKAGLSPKALGTFDKSYNTPAENAGSALDLLNAWIPTKKMTITGGQLRGSDVAILEVEGEMFPGTNGLSLVRMVKSGTAWQFEQAARAGMLP